MSLLHNNDVYLIIPSFNEAKQIRATVTPLLEQGYSVVVVDDCSSDETRSALQGLSLHFVRHPLNLGQGAALQTGMEYALKQGAAFILHFDADGQHDWQEIPSLLTPLQNGNADVALGSRFMRAEDVAAIPGLRRVILRTAIFINGLFTGMWLSDAHNGFRAFTAAAASKIHITENRMAHATEILSLIKAAGLRVAEVPVHIEYSDYSKAKGQSSLNSINILIDLVMRKIF